MGSPLKVADIIAALLKKGFVEKKGANHRKFIFHYKGKKSPYFTIISHGLKEYDSSLLGKMSRQLKLNRTELNNFIECKLKESDFIEILKSKHLLK